MAAVQQGKQGELAEELCLEQGKAVRTPQPSQKLAFCSAAVITSVGTIHCRTAEERHRQLFWSSRKPTTISTEPN